MKLWPFGNKLETRDETYSDVLIAALVSRAQGKKPEHTHGNGGARSLRGYRGPGLPGKPSHGPGLPYPGVDAFHHGDDRPVPNQDWRSRLPD